MYLGGTHSFQNTVNSLVVLSAARVVPQRAYAPLVGASNAKLWDFSTDTEVS